MNNDTPQKKTIVMSLKLQKMTPKCSFCNNQILDLDEIGKKRKSVRNISICTIM